MSQILTAFLLLVAVLGMGARPARFLKERLALPPLTQAGLTISLGSGAVGITTLLMGHLAVLTSATPLILGVMGGGLLLTDVRVLANLSSTWSAVGAGVRAQPVVAGIVLAALGLAFIATLAPPAATDEVEYHWAAAVDWADEGRWTDSPYRHVDGFPLMEVIYTAAATGGSYVAAHGLHLLCLIGLGLLTAGIAASVGVRGANARVQRRGLHAGGIQPVLRGL